MKFESKSLDVENGALQKEWIITNGLGGYASSTIIGANTRRYHGLLVSSLFPPAKRTVILSKLDESISYNGKKYDLYTNICRNYISQGFKYLDSFEKDILPVFTYKVENVEITKTICMQYGKNTVGINYKIKNGNYASKLELAPIFNFRDFHSMTKNHNFDLKQENDSGKIKIIIDKNINNPVYMKISDGNYIEHTNNIFYNMFYMEEEKRGFDPEENLVVSGVFKVNIEPNEEKEINFVCSMEEEIEDIDVKKLIKEETKRIDKLVKKAKFSEEKEDLAKIYTVAADNFVVYRPEFGLHTTIAGYPWFLDWGRDSFISFEGLLLVTKRFDIAKEVMLTFTKDIKDGLVPNGYSENDNTPLYNSADSSLLLFEQVQKYLEYTNDNKFVREKIYPKLKDIIDNYAKGIDLWDNNIYLDKDGLISSGTDTTQNTWMDAKYGDFAFTPRNGKVVELNALWYNALMIMITLVEKYEKVGKNDTIKKYSDMAKKCKKSFNEKFYNARRKCLYDVLGDSKIRPNQLFSLSLTYPVIDANSEVAKNIITVVEKKLLNKYGLKTLAKGEENYVDVYEGDGFRRDMSYHQGITWPWLLGLYYNSLLNMKKVANKTNIKKLDAKIEEFKQKTEKIYAKDLQESGCIGSISELHDSKTPYAPKGAIAQGWSVAEVFRIIFK